MAKKFTFIFLSALLTILVPNSAFSEGFQQCGIYRTHVFLDTRSKNPFFTLDSNTLVEQKIKVLRESTSQKSFCGYATVEFQIDRACRKECRAKLLRVVKYFEPYERPTRSNVNLKSALIHSSPCQK
jgi:hypothetical protein